jgi:hypothetical protein
MIAKRPARRSRKTRAALAAALATSVSCAAGFASREARAEGAGAWVAGATMAPAEQRIAVSVGPSRTTVWTSLRFVAAPGPVAILVPVPVGASLDVSSDAWFEALEEATAPRIFPPVGESPSCPGTSGPPDPFQVAGEISHVPTLPPQATALLPDAGAVASWVQQAGLTLSPATAAGLGALGGSQFLAVLFTAPGGTALTRTLRVAMPGAPAALPLALLRASGNDLLVTAWFLGQGAGGTVGTVPAPVDPATLEWEAASAESDYIDQRLMALTLAEPRGALLEAAGHEALSTSVSIAAGTASIDGVVATYFERAAAYGDAPANPAPCVTAADAAMASSEVVAASCPRADLGLVGGGAACVESPAAGTVDPAALRCGSQADDLAVALSGLSPAATWLTRQSLLIAPQTPAQDWPIGFAAGPTVTPILTAAAVDVGGCYGQDGGAGPCFASSGAGGPVGPGVTGPGSGEGAGGGHDGSGSGNGSGTNAGDVVQTALDVASDASDDDDSDSGCDCGSSSGSGSSGSSDDSSSSSGCSGSSSSDGSSSSGCDSGGDSSGCSGGDAGGGSCDCSAAGHTQHRRAPKASVLAFLALGLIAPLRRRGRRSRAKLTRGGDTRRRSA